MHIINTKMDNKRFMFSIIKFRLYQYPSLVLINSLAVQLVTGLTMHLLLSKKSSRVVTENRILHRIVIRPLRHMDFSELI